MAAKGYDRGTATEHRFVRPNVVACDSWRGKDDSYTQDLEQRTCTCPHFVHRLAGTGELCKHLKDILLPKEETVPAVQTLTDAELRRMFS